MTQPAAWHPDPLKRHEYRYWDGTQWTEHVADGGRQTSDPIDGGAPADTTTAQSQQSQPASDAGPQQPSSQPTSDAGQQQPPPQGAQPFPQAGTPAATPAAQPTGASSGAGSNNPAAIAALIIGILALVIAWVPFIGLAGVLGGVVALVLGFVGKGRARTIGNGAGLAITGLITGGLAVLTGIASTLLPVLFFQGMVGDLEEVDRCIERTGDEDACVEEHAPGWLRFFDELDELEELDGPDG